jgi:hypothetical protein
MNPNRAELTATLRHRFAERQAWLESTWAHQIFKSLPSIPGPRLFAVVDQNVSLEMPLRLGFGAPLLGKHPVKGVYRGPHTSRNLAHVSFQCLVGTTVSHDALDIFDGGTRALHPGSEGSAERLEINPQVKKLMRPAGGNT